MTIQKLVQILLESDLPLSAQGLIEASVHLPKRGSIFMASFRDEHGRQVQRTTHQRDRAAAQAVADNLEADAREKRLAMPWINPGKPRIRVRRRSAERLLGLLSHAEIAAALGLSERTIRKIEAEALRKLFLHPELRTFWREYITGEVDESNVQAHPWLLTQSEMGALFALARTSLERRALTKILVITGNILV
jgi:DNA-binding NarL/FixJ family response regulator